MKIVDKKVNTKLKKKVILHHTKMTKKKKNQSPPGGIVQSTLGKCYTVVPNPPEEKNQEKTLGNEEII